MRVPAKLEKVTFLSASKPGSTINLKGLWPCLVPYGKSLRSIRIGNTFYKGRSRSYYYQSPLDFTTFQCLVSLSLSFSSIGPDFDQRRLLTPRLEMFEWTFDGPPVGRAVLANFQQPEEDFLRRLARAAVARQVPLRKIAIVFTPRAVLNLSRSTCPPPTTLEYPWDCMGRLADELRPLGIELVYNSPSVTREQHEAAVRAHNERVEAI